MHATNDRFASLAGRLTRLVDDRIPADVAPLTDEEAIVDAMPAWAGRAADHGLEGLPNEPDFGPFWRALERAPELGELWATLVDEAQLAKERRRVSTPPTEPAAVELAWLRGMHHRRLAHLVGVAGDPQHPDRVAAAGALCQYAAAGDGAAAARLEELADRRDGLAALWMLARDPRHPDGSVARAVAPAAIATVAARRGGGLLAGVLGAFERTLVVAMADLGLLPTRGAVRLTPGLAAGMTGSSTSGQLLRRVEGTAGATGRFQLDSNGYVQTIHLRLEGLGDWTGAHVRVVFEDVDAMERLAAQGTVWEWEAPGAFVADRPVDAAGVTEVRLGVSTDDALTADALYGALPGGVRIERLELRDLPSASAEPSGR